MSNQYLTFDITKSNKKQQLIIGRQGDSQLKFVSILFWDGEKNVPYDLTGKQIVFEALKTDNTHIVDYEGITILNAKGGLARYAFNGQVFAAAGTMQQAFFKITQTDSNNNVVTDSTLEISIKVLENKVEFGINSEDYLSEYDRLVAEVEKKFDDYAATVQDSIQKAQEIHNQIVEYTNLINSNGVITRTEFGDIGVIKQPVGVTAVDKLNNEFSDRGINVKWFGAKGDGLTDDTAAIQAAIDSLQNGDNLFFERGKTYKISGLVLNNLKNVDVSGNNSTLSVIDGDDVFAFKYTGTNDNITIHGFKIVGNMLNGKTTAFGCRSGADLTNSKIYDLVIDKVNVGISLNAESAGTIEFNEVYNNVITNIFGKDPGKGYGIHLAGANHNNIHDNVIDRAQRHSIYHAFGENNDIYHNRITNHRVDIKENLGRAAIQILRSSTNVRVFDNTIINSYDGCIIINTINELGDMTNIDVFNNNIISPQGVVPAIRVGGDETSVVYLAKNIKIRQNNFQIEGLQSVIRIDDGIQVFFEDNMIDYLNLTARVNSVVVSPSVSGALDMVFISNNKFRVNGSGYQSFIGIYFGNLAPIDSTIHITAKNNLFPTIYGESVKKFTDYSSSAAVTNTNLIFRNDMKRTDDVGPTPPSSGFYTLGSICWSNNPNVSGCIGWVCVSEGAPGTWKKFGALF